MSVGKSLGMVLIWQGRIRRIQVHLFTAFAIALVVAGSGASPRTPETAAPTIKEIDKAWTSRLRQLGTFIYKIHLIDQTAINGNRRSNDPFEPLGPTIPNRYATVEKDIEIKRDGAKIWTSVEGKHWDTDTAEAFDQARLSTFDGNVYRDLITSSRAPFGLGHFGKEGTKAEQLSLSLYEAPVLWWCDPKSRMSSFGQNLDNVRITDDDVTYLEHSCVELQMIQDAVVRASIIVTKASPYLPLKVTTYSRRGAVADTNEFRYIRDNSGVERIASWSVISYLQNAVRRKQKGNVTQFIRGASFGDDDFRLRFPIGTNIIEYTPSGSRFWIQSTADEMQPLKAADYGRLPKPIGGPAS